MADSPLSACQVGRPRPNFMARCFPETVAEPIFHMGMPECQAGNIRANTEGRKSFPSGAPVMQLCCCDPKQTCTKAPACHSATRCCAYYRRSAAELRWMPVPPL